MARFKIGDDAIDHAEAWDLAHHRQENSNLARCYIDLRMAVKGLLGGDSMARLEEIDASIADSTVKIGNSQSSPEKQP